jgi:zinc transport system permease protein
MDQVYELISNILPFSWAEHTFMVRALLAVILVSPLCAAMGVLVVNFRMAFFSDAISHSAFTGVALGVLFGVDPRITLVAFGVLVGLAIVVVRRGSSLSIDTVIGVLLSFAVALGIVIISAKKSLTRDLHAYLYGDVLTVSDNEILLIGLLALVCLIFLWLYFNDLFLVGVNESVAKAHGVKVKFLEYSYALLLALVVTMTIRIVGLLLVTAMLIVPAAAGRNFARSVRTMFWATVLTGLFAGITGLVSSYYLKDAASGGTIILVACIVFIFSQIYSLVRR